jgi:hypothetical protein
MPISVNFNCFAISFCVIDGFVAISLMTAFSVMDKSLSKACRVEKRKGKRKKLTISRHLDMIRPLLNGGCATDQGFQHENTCFD